MISSMSSMPRRYCVATKSDGQPCRAAPLRDAAYCFLHDPDRAEDAAKARHAGGVRRRREGTLGVVYDLQGLETVAGIRRLLEIVVDDALGLDAGIGRSRILVAVANSATKLLETAELEARLEALEGAVRLLQRREPSKGLDDGMLGGSDE
jgi:hypothetical protein